MPVVSISMTGTVHRGGAVVPLAAMLVASRVALLVVGIASHTLLPSGADYQPGNLHWLPEVSAPLEVWARWDAEWYLLIAARGYDVGGDVVGWGWSQHRDAAAGFFPLYPWTVRMLAPLLGLVGAGVVVSNVALVVAVWLLYRLVSDEIGGERGHEAGLAACAALLAWPMSPFLSAVYPASMFLALTLAASLAARRRRFAAAALWGGLAALTKPFGVLLAVVIGWEWLVARRRRETTGWSIVAAAGPVVGLGIFAWMCARTFGDPLAFVARQAAWRGDLSGPWAAWARWWQAGPTVHGAHTSTLEAVLGVITVVVLVAAARWLRASWLAYAAAALVIAFGSTLWSFGRLMLGVFPVFVAVGAMWADGRRVVTGALMWVGAVTSGLVMVLYAAWWWAG
jgi:hypothetical protein